MATWASTNWMGGAVGAAVTATTEPLFTNKLGTLNYAVDHLGTGQSAESPSVSGNLTLALGSRSSTGTAKFRMMMDVYRQSGTASAGGYVFQLKTGATTVADVFLRRNATDLQVQPALRGTSLAYLGQVGGVGNTGGGEGLDNGETWHMEFWATGTTAGLDIWTKDNANGPANYSFSGTVGGTWDSVIVGNAATNGMTIRYESFRATDGEAYRAPASIVNTQAVRRAANW